MMSSRLRFIWFPTLRMFFTTPFAIRFAFRVNLHKESTDEIVENTKSGGANKTLDNANANANDFQIKIQSIDF